MSWELWSYDYWLETQLYNKDLKIESDLYSICSGKAIGKNEVINRMQQAQKKGCAVLKLNCINIELTGWSRPRASAVRALPSASLVSLSRRWVIVLEISRAQDLVSTVQNTCWSNCFPLSWSVKGFHIYMDVISEWQSTTIFLRIRPFLEWWQTNKHPNNRMILEQACSWPVQSFAITNSQLTGNQV